MDAVTGFNLASVVRIVSIRIAVACVVTGSKKDHQDKKDNFLHNTRDNAQ
jgi:hypothetical protein